MLDISDLVVRRGRRTVIHHLSLAVPKGKVYALLGGNGAGKTTTLDVLLGLVTPASGVVTLDDMPLQDRRVNSSRIAYLPEIVALYPYLTGIENLRYFCAVGGIDLSREQAVGLLSANGLHPEAHGVRVAQYSKGMRQKVGLAIALARPAALLLLDEPTSGLDPGAADEMAQRVRRAADGGMAVLMTTHDLLNAKQLADRIGILRGGVLVAEFDVGTIGIEDLFRAYRACMRDCVEGQP